LNPQTITSMIDAWLPLLVYSVSYITQLSCHHPRHEGIWEE
jgi:hypothetical protein